MLCSRLRTLQALVSALFFAALPAHAMVVARRDFPELVARAEAIVVGTVTDVQNVEDASGAPLTLVTFSNLSVMKGDAADSLTLRFYGGKAGGVTVQIPDMPTFSRGERDVLFVAGNNRDLCPLVGVWQGRFHVRFEAARGTEVVEDNDGRPLAGLLGRELRRAPLRADATPTMTLDEFRQRIADELAHSQGANGGNP